MAACIAAVEEQINLVCKLMNSTIFQIGEVLLNSTQVG
jgi:hypothetical protein